MGMIPQEWEGIGTIRVIPTQYVRVCDKCCRFGQLHSELYRACEMVIDTGIHAYRYNQQIAQFFNHKF